MHPTAALFTSQHMEATWVPIDRWMDKKDGIHTDTLEYCHLKKNETFPFATTCMDLEGIMLSEISQAEKAKYIWFHLYVESKNKINEQHSKTVTDIDTRTNELFPEGRQVGKNEIGEA